MNAKKHVNWALYRALLGYMRPQGRYVVGLVITMLLTAAIDIAFPLLAMYAIDNYIMQGALSALPGFAVLYMGLALAQGLNVVLFVRFGGKIELYMARDMRQKMFEKLQVLSLSYYDRTPIGQIMSRMLPDVARLSEMLAWSLVDGAWAVAYMVGVISVMLGLNAQLGLIVLGTLAPLALISIYFQRRILRAQRKVRHINAEIAAAYNEGIMGAKTTKTLVYEEQNLEAFSLITGRMRRASVRSALFSSIYVPVVMVIGSICVSLILWTGGAQAAAGAITIGALTSFINYATGFFDPVNQMARIIAEMQSAQAAAERVVELINMPPEIADSPAIEARYGTAFAPRKENWPAIEGAVRFERVTFRYKQGEPVLRDFSLDVPPGAQIALVGETGAGKSTIVNLLGRFYEPQQGRILIDGVDIRERSQLWLQSNLGYVLQNPHLFSGTVRENIRYGNLDATDAMVEQAARMVYAHDFILQLEQGYESPVGEGGNRLSTGQKQLIAFARAVLADPRIFVLDEATSSIDTQAEQLIQRAIGKLLAGRTSFIIAHRLSTIRGADRILVIEDGAILEQGTHDELMRKKGAYYTLYTNQYQEQSQRRLTGKTLVAEE
nr:ABC transporter ATP-binding protein [Maliibacterium massiliense]